jgi:N-acetylmuramoyl-L-alanine amidase
MHPVDYYVTALTLYREGRGESVEGRRAILHVILNRVKDKRWPDTPARVCLQNFKRSGGKRIWQFSCYMAGDPNASLIPSPDDAVFKECCNLVEYPGDDPTQGANHYHTNAVNPAWSDPSKVTARIGSHLFLKL